MYGKLFESMYDGTLVEDWRALVTFQQMIILCDADGIIDMTADAISNRTGIPLEYIKAGIEILESTDENSRTPDLEGRRIILIDEHRSWGWYVVNHSKYKQLVDANTVRQQNRVRKQRQREKEKLSHDVTGGHACHAMSRHTDTYTDIKDQESGEKNATHSPHKKSLKPKNGKTLPEGWTLPDDWKVWTEENCPLVDAISTAAEFRDWALGNSNRAVGRKANWFATWRNWCRRDNERYKAQEQWQKDK